MSYNFAWSLLCMGLYFMLRHSDARAVNVSNTWTMPQGGLNVFYRFFRDRISWFEADAVCQFHHANLVTVDNSFQFDATRDLLRELDVNDIVWIGLMRPQNSERFVWSNSKPLVSDAGYWAESLPLMDAPLCAVIDPIRDYRWHALRCGGPETASFLCEMPVPNWAEACILKDMPYVTMQYMADTASIELIKNCQQEGLLKATCKGKQDREQAIQSLICPHEHIDAQRIRALANSHIKSSQIVNGISTDNNENNNIDLLQLETNYGSNTPMSVLNTENLPTEKNTVQKLIEQFNVDELMQADEPKTHLQNRNDYYKLSATIPKPVKKSIKKLSELSKKDVAKQKLEAAPKENKQNHFANINDMMMMADQPAIGEPEMVEHILDDVTNEITEPLPHIKKIRPQDLHTAAIIQEKFHNAEELPKLVGNKEMKTLNEKNLEEEVTTAPIAVPTKMNHHQNNEKNNLLKHKNQTQNSFKEKQLNEQEQITSVASTTTIAAVPQITTTIVSITHPIHPQTQSHNTPNNEPQPQHPTQYKAHAKETPDNSHFIPPMLLVKSHYIPTNNRQHTHSSTHPDIQEEATHGNAGQKNEENEKVMYEQFDQNVEKSNSMKMAEKIFQDNKDIMLATTTTTAAAPTTAAAKLIVHDYQQKLTPNFVNVAKAKETNANTTDHETNPYNNEHHNDNNNNSNNNNIKNNNSAMNGIKVSTTSQTINSKIAQQELELELEQERHTAEHQWKLNKYEHIANESNSNGKSSKGILLQQQQHQKQQHQKQQQHQNVSSDIALTNGKTDNIKLMIEATKATATVSASASTTDQMHDLVEVKVSENSPTLTTDIYINADKGNELTMEKYVMTTDATTKITQTNAKQNKQLLNERLVEAAEEKAIENVMNAKAIDKGELKEEHKATTQFQLQLKQQQQQQQQQQENITPMAKTKTTTTTIRIEPSLDEEIIVATRKKFDVTEIVTPKEQSTEMLSFDTMDKTQEQKQKQIDNKHEIRMLQKESLEQVERSHGIKATIATTAVTTTTAAIPTTKVAKTLNTQTEILTKNSSETNKEFDGIEIETHKAKIEERAAFANITKYSASTTANDADVNNSLKGHSVSFEALLSTPFQVLETSSATTTEAVAETSPPATAAAAAAVVGAANVETTRRNFLKLTTEEPYKPNRRRTLTKPESPSYIKKILG